MSIIVTRSNRLPQCNPGLILSSVGFVALVATLMMPLAATAQTTGAQIAPDQTAVGTGRTLKLAPDSPFRDPNIIYLEADELINDEEAGTLTATGEVEGRYQDRTIRADQVDYDLNTGIVLATGNVVLIDATGDIQYADKIELSNELQAGTAANFTARLATGATTAARFVTREENGEFELYNVTYTACEICRDSEGEAQNPTWRLRARKVRQDTDSRTIRYRDAVLEVFGLPVFYTPYLAHPDPSQDRASGLLAPMLGISGARGFQLELPYYAAIDDYTEATVTPHLFTKVNPLLNLQARRRFHTGEINLDGSMTYGTLFDRNGDPLDDPSLFTDPLDAPEGAEFSGHVFLDGYFRPSDVWSYGYTAMLQTDDTYLDRYGLPTRFETNGLVANESRLHSNQAFIAGQGDNFRLSALAVGFQSINSRFILNETTGLITFRRDNDDQLPTIVPLVRGEYYATDPAIGGRVRLFGDATYLTREQGNDYGRATAGAEYSKTFIAPAGIEMKPFVWGRFDQYDLAFGSSTAPDPAMEANDISFSRGIGQAGLDVRYPFIKRGSSIDWIIEPRALYTEGFGDAKLDRFIDPLSDESVFEDGSSPELDRALLYSPNKADGFDFFQEGRRLDVGASVAAHWQMNGSDSHLRVFGGQSFAENTNADFSAGTGLGSGTSDYIGEFDMKLGRYFNGSTRLRYDEDRSTFSRIDSSASVSVKYVSLSARYFNVNTPTAALTNLPDFTSEEVSGTLTIRPNDNWSASFRTVRDLGRDISRNSRFSVGYRDDCTSIDVFYTVRNLNNDAIRNDQTIGIRFTLSTLGSFGSN